MMEWVVIVVAGIICWVVYQRKSKRLVYSPSTVPTTPDYHKEYLAYAIPGTFDARVFESPKTGNFSFPKYNQNLQFLVQIKDKTDYRSEFWEHLEPDERRSYTLRDFERDLFCGGPELEVDSFETFFGRLKKEDLSPQDYLKGHYEEVEALITSLHDPEEPYADGPKEMIQKLVKDSFLEEYEERFESDREKRVFLEALTKEELRPLSQAAGVGVSQKKADQVAQLVEKGAEIPPLKLYRATDQFRIFFEGLCDRYVKELRRNADRFHPLYIPHVWDIAADEAGDLNVNTLANKIQAIIDSKYWELRLSTNPA